MQVPHPGLWPTRFRSLWQSLLSRGGRCTPAASPVFHSWLKKCQGCTLANWGEKAKICLTGRSQGNFIFFFSDQVYSMVSILPQLFTMLCRLIFLSCLGELLICTYCSHLPLGALRRRKCRVCFLLFRAPFPRESNLRGAPSVLFFLFGWAALFLWGIVDAKKK